MQCIKNGHKYTIDTICTYSQCQQPKLCCSFCGIEHHYEHKQYIIGIGHFIDSQKNSLNRYIETIHKLQVELQIIESLLNMNNYNQLRPNLENYLKQREFLQLDIQNQQQVNNSNVQNQQQEPINEYPSEVFQPIFRPKKKIIPHKDIKEQSISEIYKESQAAVQRASMIKVQKKQQKDELDYFSEGLQLFNQKDFKNALPLFEMALQIKINYLEAWIHKILSEAELRLFDQAIKSSFEGKKKCQNSNDLYFVCGLIYEEVKQYQNAFKEFEFVINNNRKNCESLFHAGYVSHQLNNFEKAEQYLMAVLAINNNHKHSKLLLGQIKLDQRQIKQAQDYFQSVNEGIAILHNGNTVIIKIANCMKLQKQFNQALTEIERYCQFHPFDEKGQILKGEILLYSNKIDEGMKLFEKIYKQNPNLQDEINKLICDIFENKNRQ